MIVSPMIGAILRAQLLSLRVGSGSRAASVAFSAITGLLYYGVWAFFAAGAVIMFSAPAAIGNFVAAISFALLLTMIYWQVAPILTASYGASLDLRKLLVYPISPRDLFVIEILLRIARSIETLLVIAGICIGLLRNPLFGLRAAPFIFAGALAFIAMNTLIAAGSRIVIERWFRTSRWKELMFLLFVAASLAPQFLLRAHVSRKLFLRFAPSEILLPWAAAGRFMLGNRPVLTALVVLVWLALCCWFSRWQFYRSLRFDTGEFRRPETESRAAGIIEGLYRLPSRFFPDPIGALMEKEVRVLSRIPRVRMVFAMSCFFGLILFLPSITRGERATGPFVENALPIMAVYGLLMLAQLTFWNAFGFDRSAAMGYFCWPIRFRYVLIAKNITVALILLPQLVLVWLMTAVIRLPASPGKFIESVFVLFAASLYWFGIGNIASVRLPRAMNPDKMNQMSGKMEALTIWTAPFLLLPVVLAYIARAVFHSQIVFAGVMAIALVIGVIFYVVALESAVESAHKRREQMLADLSRSDGPVSIS